MKTLTLSLIEDFDKDEEITPAMALALFPEAVDALEDIHNKVYSADNFPIPEFSHTDFTYWLNSQGRLVATYASATFKHGLVPRYYWEWSDNRDEWDEHWRKD